MISLVHESGSSESLAATLNYFVRSGTPKLALPFLTVSAPARFLPVVPAILFALLPVEDDILCLASGLGPPFPFLIGMDRVFNGARWLF